MRSHLFGPTAGRTALILATVLALPFCWTGMFADDYFQQLAIEGHPWMPVTPWDLFTFAWGDPVKLAPIIERGPYSWWTLPELKFSFLRPLTCALAQLDHLVFGRAFFFHHLHSVAWYVGLVAVVTMLLKRALGIASPIAALAAILFAIDDAHTVIAGWVANRNAMIATAPALLGVLAHVWWRERGARAGLPLSLIAVAIGLAGGEPALGAIAYLIAYELTAGPGTWKTRLLSLVPLALLGVGYILIYRALGAGAYGSEMYVDPVREPLRYLVQAPPKALALIGAQFLGSTADLWLMMINARPVLVIMGVVAVGLMFTLLRRVWPTLDETERRGLRWLTVGALLSIPPVLATFPLNRLLLMPSIGGSALIAAVLFHGWRAANDRVLRYGARLLFVTSVVVGVLGWPGAAFVLRLGDQETTRTSLETKLSDETLGGKVFAFVAPDPAASLYVPMVRAWHHKPVARVWTTFSFAPFAHRLTRVSADTFELEVVEGRMLETVFEQLMRSTAHPVPLGMTVALEGAEVTVLGLDQGLPNKLRVHFDEPPERGGYTLVSWETGALTALKVPEVGQTLELPRVRSLMSP